MWADQTASEHVLALFPVKASSVLEGSTLVNGFKEAIGGVHFYVWMIYYKNKCILSLAQKKNIYYLKMKGAGGKHSSFLPFCALGQFCQIPMGEPHACVGTRCRNSVLLPMQLCLLLT